MDPEMEGKVLEFEVMAYRRLLKIPYTTHVIDSEVRKAWKIFLQWKLMENDQKRHGNKK